MRYLLLGWMLWLPAGSAQAQLRLPGLPLVQRPLASLQQPLAGVGSDLAGTVGEARRRAVRALLHDYPQRIEADPQGNVAVRHELLAYRSPEALPAAVMQAGFSLLREVRSEALELHLSVLAPPPGMPTAKALAMLKRLDPGGLYDYNHLYLGGGQLQAETPLELPEHAPEAPTVRGVRVGLIDTGIERSHPAFGAARIRAWGCGGSTRGGAHGTAIASLMVGRAPPFHGVLPEAELYAADIYCGEPTGGALDALLGALGWLAHERVPVINVSLVGPNNVLLGRAVGALVAQGFTIVAAVGNDGPAAPPLYPASYAGVVGVTAVDAHLKVLVEAARGPQVMFAAVGADLVAAAGQSGYASARGTSFAAPVVAVLLATQLVVPSRETAQAALDALTQIADPRRPVRDLTYGFGVVGTQYRNDPANFSHP